jgi:cytochrome P450
MQDAVQRNASDARVMLRAFRLPPAAMPEPLSSSPSASNTSVLPTQRTPPGPRGLPWIGCTAGLLADPLRFWTRIARRFSGLARIPLQAGRSMLFVAEPQLIKELLIDRRAQYSKHLRYPAFLRLFGEGLFTSEGETWRRQRLLSQAAFKPAALRRHLEWMRDAIADFRERWEAPAQAGAALDMQPELVRLTQLLSGTLTAGPAFVPRADAVYEIMQRVNANWPPRPNGVFRMLFPPRDHGRAARLEQAIRDLDREMYDLVRAQLTAAPGSGCALELLSAGAKGEGRPFSETELRDQAVNLFIAGYETTAAAMCWTLKALSDHPEVRARVHAEIDAVIGKGLPTPEDLERMPYLEQVLAESLRLYTPLHSLSRTAQEDSELGGYPVPRGCTVTVSMYATHRLPQHWPEPEKFDPERFLPEQCAARSQYAYLPFAVGPRNCIGSVLAVQESKLILALTLQRYRLDLAPGEKVEALASTTMRPRDGLPMVLRPR